MAKNPLSTILEQNKLNGANFVDWLRNLKIVLQSEKKKYVLDTPPPKAPAAEASEEERAKYLSHMDDDLHARCYMLASMSNELQRNNEEKKTANEILLHLQSLYGEKIRQQRYKISKELFRIRMTEGSSVHDHGLKVIALTERLASLGVVIQNELYTDLLLQSLPPSFDTFVVNFNMHNMETSLSDLVNMLVTAESTMKREKPIMLVGSSSGSKTAKSKKRKGKGNVPSKSNKLKAKGGVKKVSKQANDKCHHCGKTGHWKRNCKDYLASLKSSGIYFVEVNLSVNDASWVLDTGCGSHICSRACRLILNQGT